MAICMYMYYGSAGLLRFLAVGKRTSRQQLTAVGVEKLNLCFVFVAPLSLVALQRIAVRQIHGLHRTLKATTV